MAGAPPDTTIAAIVQTPTRTEMSSRCPREDEAPHANNLHEPNPSTGPETLAGAPPDTTTAAIVHTPTRTEMSSRCPTTEPPKKPSTKHSKRSPTEPSSRPSTEPLKQPSTKPSKRSPTEPSRWPTTEPQKEPSTKPSKRSPEPSSWPSTVHLKPSIKPSKWSPTKPSSRVPSEPLTQTLTYHWNKIDSEPSLQVNRARPHTSNPHRAQPRDQLYTMQSTRRSHTSGRLHQILSTAMTQPLTNHWKKIASEPSMQVNRARSHTSNPPRAQPRDQLHTMQSTRSHTPGRLSHVLSGRGRLNQVLSTTHVLNVRFKHVDCTPLRAEAWQPNAEGDDLHRQHDVSHDHELEITTRVRAPVRTEMSSWHQQEPYDEPEEAWHLQESHEPEETLEARQHYELEITTRERAPRQCGRHCHQMPHGCSFQDPSCKNSRPPSTGHPENG
jgi:hypothetical protein